MLRRLRIGTLPVVFLILMPFIGCASGGGARIEPIEAALGGGGWQCHAAPDAFKKAGVVLEQLRDGQYYYDSDHSSLSISGPSAIGEAEHSVNSTIGGIASLLRQAGVFTLPTSASIDLHRQVTVQAKYGNTMKYVVGGEAVDSILRVFASRQLAPTSRYILIRESQSAGSIDIEMSRGVVAALSAGLNLDSLVNANAKIARTDTSHYRLKDTYPAPLGICTLGYELSVTRGAAGKTEVRLGSPFSLLPDAAIGARKP